MNDRLHNNDLEMIVGAIEGLAAKIDTLGERPAPVDHHALAEVIVGMNAANRNAVADSLGDVLRRLDAATGALEREGAKGEARLLGQRTALMHDTGLERDRRRRWQWTAGIAALVLLLALLTGPWLAHSVYVRTVSGCFALGGEFLNAKPGSGNPDVCWFNASEPR